MRTAVPPSLHITLSILVFVILTHAGAARAANGWACGADEKLCRSLFVVHDSWHAAIVLRRDDLSQTAMPELADFPDARFVEFSWGDKDYFPDPDSGFSMAIKAAFWSSGSVLHLVGSSEDLKKSYPKAEIVELRLSGIAFDRLIDFLSQSFDRPKSTGRAPARPGLYPYSRFYLSTRKFSVLNTCNTWVAQALETGGLPVSSSRVITAGQLSEQLDKMRAPR
jgi:uncharacterized protein (TIGR02117 family)